MSRTDDPSGGAGLTRRLKRWLPIAFGAGLAVGIVLAVLSGEWRVALMTALGVAAVTGVILAAVEDGRVNRWVNRGGDGR
jgi:Flp pilus assembly protein TadB